MRHLHNHASKDELMPEKIHEQEHMQPPDLVVRAEATVWTVASITAHLKVSLGARGYPKDWCGSIELAVAEALNNISEHAYGSADVGPVVVSLYLDQRCVRIDLCDLGRPISDNDQMPEGQLPEIGDTIDDLPEGGFGWYLIRSLTQQLRYERADGENRLTMIFDLPPVSAVCSNPDGTGS